MSKFGLGLMAADSAIRENQAIEQRGQQTERFGWEKKRAEADLSTLDDRAGAQRAQAQLQAKQAQAGLGLVDQKTKNDASQLSLDAVRLDGAKARQPMEIAAEADKAKVGELLAGFDLESTPQKIAQAKAQGVLSQADVYVTSISKLVELMDSNDTGQVIKFMNGMNDAGVLAAKHAPVAKVGIQKGADGRSLFIALDAQGNTVASMNVDDMKRVKESAGKSTFEKVNAGDSLVKIQGGQATPVFTAPESERTRAARTAGTGPLERDVSYLVNAHGMTQQQALAHLNQAKSMSREQFILKGVQDKQAMGKKASEQDIEELGGLYDRASGREAKPSNSPSLGNVDPQIRSLIGIP